MVAQPAGHGVISGTVIDASSGDPVRKAIVTITWHGTPRAWATTRTDGSGRFIVEGLPAGKYDLRAGKPGLGTAIYGANSVRELGDLLTLGESEIHGGVKLRFLRSASISGTVVDPDGDPIPGAVVAVLHRGRQLGEPILTNGQSTTTNDRGEYRITGIDPGEFFLRCLPNVPRPMGSVQNPIVVPQYFGGAHNSKDAAPLTVRAGDILTGIDFHLTSQHPARISGRVTGVPPLDPPPDPPAASPTVNVGRTRNINGQQVAISLTPADNNQFTGGGGASARPPDFRFDLPDTIPSRYRIEASVRAGDKTYYASQLIDAGEGPNDIVLAMAPAVTVKGHLTVEGSALHPADSFTVMLNPSRGRGRNYSARVKKDGSFLVEDVPPGPWILNVNPTPAALFEKTVRLGDKDFLYQQIEIPPGLDAPLHIVISSNTATVTGEIDAGGAQARQAGISSSPSGPAILWRVFTIRRPPTMPENSS